MKSINLLPAILLATLACSDDSFDLNDETSSTSTETGSQETETGETGDMSDTSDDETSGDGDPSGDGDGDMCPVGSEGCSCTEGGYCDSGLECLSSLCVDLGSNESGDGDGDGIETASLEVEADGQRIGYFLGIDNFTIRIWDDAQNFIFSVNDTTGFVAGYNNYYYESDDCTGSAYVLSAYCGLGAPVRRYVWGSNLDQGFTQSDFLITTHGEGVDIVYKSLQTVDDCIQYPNNIIPQCLYATTIVDSLPTSFPLPIKVVESN